MPYGAVISLEQAHAIVCAADQPNGGLLIDTWHCHRTGIGAQDLEALPPDCVIGVQVSDVRPEPLPDLRFEARHLRRLPGDGTADIVGTLRALAGFHRVTSVAVEVMSDELDALDSVVVAQRTHASLQRLLGDAGWAREPAGPRLSGLVPDPPVGRPFQG
jgi:sugar phosphate isomerase/epimerase